MKKAIVVSVVALALVAGISIGAWAERQPHMVSALKHLQAARQELANAKQNKGGHRVNALRLIDDAIEEVRAGIDYANTH